MNTEIDLSTLTNRLNYILKITGTRKADLARAIGVKPQIIQFLCTTQTRSSRFTFELATALGLNTRWLATGEGEMFVADDAEQIFFKNYKKIPLLSHQIILKKILKKESLCGDNINCWIPLKTERDDIFSVQANDNSMEPNIPNESYVYVQENSDFALKEKDLVFVLLKQYDAFVIREVVINNKITYLSPKNSQIFKEIPFSEDTEIIGKIIGCFWHIRS